MYEELEEQFDALRAAMVRQIAMHAELAGDRTRRPRLSERVMQVMASVPRHRFVPVEMQPFAYFDTPLPIGYEKTISQPYIVALMTDLLDLSPADRVLDVGTGLGYQAAVLARLAREVYSVEIIEELAHAARRRLADAGAQNVQVRVADGSRGWTELAPFDKILVAAAPELIPTKLLAQLAPAGRMVIPAGIEDAQQLMLVEKDGAGRLSTREVLAVRFSTLANGD